jgi:hypothetical protein
MAKSAGDKVNPKITDCQYVASYNWLDEKDPVILVPGEKASSIPLSPSRNILRPPVPCHQGATFNSDTQCHVESL